MPGTARAASAIAMLLTTACLPYTVASTARTAAPGHVTQTSIAYLIPNGIDIVRDQPPVAMPGVDYEARYGLDERSDIGVRVPSYSGAVVTYKRRLSGDENERTAATAVMAGAGVVNWGQHAHAELTFLASAPESWSGGVAPYGGLRVMQVAPIERHATHDTPTAGGFLGLRMGNHLHGISPEVGVYYDHSALGLRHGNLIVVPALAIYGHHAQEPVDDGAGSGGAPPRERIRRAPTRLPVGTPVGPMSGAPRAPTPFPAASRRGRPIAGSMPTPSGVDVSAIDARRNRPTSAPIGRP